MVNGGRSPRRVAQGSHQRLVPGGWRCLLELSLQGRTVFNGPDNRRGKQQDPGNPRK